MQALPQHVHLQGHRLHVHTAPLTHRGLSYSAAALGSGCYHLLSLQGWKLRLNSKDHGGHARHMRGLSNSRICVLSPCLLCLKASVHVALTPGFNCLFL